MDNHTVSLNKIDKILHCIKTFSRLKPGSFRHFCNLRCTYVAEDWNARGISPYYLISMMKRFILECLPLASNTKSDIQFVCSNGKFGINTFGSIDTSRHTGNQEGIIYFLPEKFCLKSNFVYINFSNRIMEKIIFLKPVCLIFK